MCSVGWTTRKTGLSWSDSNGPLIQMFAVENAAVPRDSRYQNSLVTGVVPYHIKSPQK